MSDPFTRDRALALRRIVTPALAAATTTDPASLCSSVIATIGTIASL